MTRNRTRSDKRRASSAVTHELRITRTQVPFTLLLLLLWLLAGCCSVLSGPGSERGRPDLNEVWLLSLGHSESDQAEKRAHLADFEGVLLPDTMVRSATVLAYVGDAEGHAGPLLSVTVIGDQLPNRPVGATAAAPHRPVGHMTDTMLFLAGVTVVLGVGVLIGSGLHTRCIDRQYRRLAQRVRHLNAREATLDARGYRAAICDSCPLNTHRGMPPCEPSPVDED